MDLAIWDTTCLRLLQWLAWPWSCSRVPEARPKRLALHACDTGSYLSHRSCKLWPEQGGSVSSSDTMRRASSVCCALLNARWARPSKGRSRLVGCRWPRRAKSDSWPSILVCFGRSCCMARMLRGIGLLRLWAEPSLLDQEVVRVVDGRIASKAVSLRVQLPWSFSTEFSSKSNSSKVDVVLHRKCRDTIASRAHRSAKPCYRCNTFLFEII